jgi:teichuronic acid biosynthesis glycosyltransferase TuaG
MKTSINPPLVSVIVTTFNRKELLKETINSILKQTFIDFELIVVDNYSDYNFIDYIKSFGDNKLIAFQNKNNGIIAVNRNYGIKKAKGKYIAFCDDDDCWDSEKLSKQVPYLMGKKIMGVGSIYSIIGSFKNTKKTSQDKIKYLKFEDVIQSNKVALSSLIIKKRANHFFNEDRQFIGLEDWYFQLNILYNNNNKIILLPEKLLYYRIHDQNFSINADQIKRGFFVLDKYKKKIDHSLYRNSKANLYFSMGLENLLQNQRKKSVIYFIKSANLAFDIYLKSKSLIMVIFSLFPATIQRKLLYYYGYNIK